MTSAVLNRIGDVLDVIERTDGRLNFNDALLVVLQEEGVIGEVASFDRRFDVVMPRTSTNRPIP